MEQPVINPAVVQRYCPLSDRFDEMRGGNGSVRPHWHLCSQELESLGVEGLNRRSAAIGKLVHENGTTFQVDDDASEQPRPWQLASVPTIIDAQSWKIAEAGLQQRTRLLATILQDFLGPQQLLRDQIVPPELLWSNPFFNRNYHGLQVSTHPLHITATEISRDLNGNWLVQSDRTRAPSGLGYLLENRVITSRLYPQLIRDVKTQRIAGFFNSLRDHVRSLAASERDNPRVGLLTPTTGNYRQFEDAYLARYLGFTLVKGADLAVRGGELNLKTLGGLQPIQVLWRHISDRHCDPLELDPGSTDGVTGMMRVLRNGKLSLANGLGSVLVQAPALMPYLSAACQYFFKQPLLLQNVATYWCGNPSDLQYVKTNLDHLLIRPAFRVTGEPPVVVSGLSSAARTELIEAIQRRPQDYVAQQRPTYATTPVWRDDQLKPWHVSLRCFQLNTGQRVDVLPGALARLSDDENDLDQTPASGRLTQDCWVIGDSGAEDKISLLHPDSKPIVLRRSGDELPSRVAEHLFWMARYAERGEAISRLLRTVLLRLGGERTSFQLPELPRLVGALAAMGQIDPDYALDFLGANIPKAEDILPHSVLDLKQPRGLAQSIEQMKRNATAVRDRLSLDAYRIVQQLSDLALTPFADEDDGAKLARLDEIVAAFMALAGITAESFVRTHARQFLELGRRIERADHTSELLLATIAKPTNDVRAVCESVLETSDSLMTYRSRYLNLVRLAPVIDLLVTDETNPRSLRFQLDEIVSLLTGLPGVSRTVGVGADERIALDLQHELIMGNANVLGKLSPDESLKQLRKLLTRIIDELPSLSDAVSARYLTHTGHLQTLTGIATVSATE